MFPTFTHGQRRTSAFCCTLKKLLWKRACVALLQRVDIKMDDDDDDDG